MSRQARFVAVVAVAGVLAGGPAAYADFHPACADNPAAALATVSLTASGSQLVFTGLVRCHGADLARIDSLELRQARTGTVLASAPSVSCTNCPATPITTSGSVDAFPGGYEVHMTFTTTDAVGGTFQPSRSTTYLYAGAGDPVRLV